MDDGVKVHIIYIGEYNPPITDLDYIKIWMRDDSDLSMIVRFHDRLPRWIIKTHPRGASLKIIGSNLYEESDSAFNSVTKEVFMEYLESTNKTDYEWVLWNLGVLDGKYHAAPKGKGLTNSTNDD